MTFLTFHIVRALPMHNLNRDQNGLPKSQFDGGIQRGRLSSQSIKRPARIAFRDAVAGTASAPTSVRTMDTTASKIVVDLAEELATRQEKTFDRAAAKKVADSIVRSLAKSSGGSEKEDSEKKDNILLFSQAEFDTLAQAILDGQHGGGEPSQEDFIQDFRSASLDVAAFGRMFAARSDLSTQAAVAVSHAITTHEMSLTVDYFTALDDNKSSDREDAGASHLGDAYYTSGVYYSTFTVDTAQLARSWSGIHSESAREQIQALINSLVRALPSGKVTNTNPHTLPSLVLVEEQRSRVVYEFETPVQADDAGGYKDNSIRALAAQVELARSFDGQNFIETFIFAPGSTDLFPSAEDVTYNQLIARAADLVFEQTRA